MTHLPTDAAKRKATPIYSGVMKYFPKALAAVADLSRVGNEQHNPGQPLHWDRSKSTDELDALTRHLVEAGTVDTDGVRHSTKVAWRALANLEKELEAAEAGGTDDSEPRAGFSSGVYTPKVGDRVCVVEVASGDDDPAHAVGDVCVVADGSGPSVRYPGFFVLFSDDRRFGTWCRVVPA